jgi:hypothetical protein
MFGDPHLLQQVHGPLLLLTYRILVSKVHRQHDILKHRQGRQKLEGLENNAHVLAAPPSSLFCAQLVHRGAVHPYLSRSGLVKASDHVNERGLASARLAGDDRKLACVDLQVNALERHTTCR